MRQRSVRRGQLKQYICVGSNFNVRRRQKGEWTDGQIRHIGVSTNPATTTGKLATDRQIAMENTDRPKCDSALGGAAHMNLG